MEAGARWRRWRFRCDCATRCRRSGQRDFRTCVAYHSFEPGRNMTGPTLSDLWGRKAGGYHSSKRQRSPEPPPSGLPGLKCRAWGKPTRRPSCLRSTMGDRASVIFAAPDEIAKTIES
ncbi:hypothetical protein OCA5_c05310 [Afipia carboxidovorans OM5]|uniref:Uncharacterized protein n=1 Tax=Afipia carboxidovorans (strain ATCC 49405 / DSM 1227 / KCTC 32145 / OM5) TaxID=504832 RepID=F8BWB7_AFIC5|nr:hypothetical protein OCA4_c05300 [Afipia carboxidovorans OM4]AEI05255.1 hypothetical protein OCA5_c05310 [Afipia carboxidovorans OM5]